MRKPSPSQLDGQLDELAAALKQAKRVVPILAEQARLERSELQGNLPTAKVVCTRPDCDGSPHFEPWDCPVGASRHRLDWHGRREDSATGIRDVGDVVIAFDESRRRRRTGDPDPAADLERLAGWYADVGRLVGSTRRLLGQIPAVALAVHDGRKPTDGRSADEYRQRKYVRALMGDPCLVVTDHDDDDRFGPGMLRRGLCDRHRKAWGREVERAMETGRPAPDIEGFITGFGPRVGDNGGVADLSAYRTNLKEVA